MREHQQSEIKEILSSRSGKRLITAMMIIQPITTAELKNFLSLCLMVFKPYMSINRPFPDLSEIDIKKIPEIKKIIEEISFLVSDFSGEEKYAYMENEVASIEKSVFGNIFNDRDLFSQNGILKRAEKCGLVYGIPRKKGNKIEKLYFLNSDLEFILKPGKFEVKENTLSQFKKQEFDEYTKRLWKGIKKIKKGKEEVRKEWISLSDEDLKISRITDFSIKSFLNWVSWIIKYPDKMHNLWEIALENETIRRKDLGWRNDLIEKAIRDNILLRYPDHLNLTPAPYNQIPYISFRFARSYEILRCFSNFDDIFTELKTRTPMELLKLLTSENYEILPHKRTLFFSSIIAKISSSSGLPTSRNDKEIIITRNSQLIKQILSPHGFIFFSAANKKNRELFFDFLKYSDAYRDLWF